MRRTLHRLIRRVPRIEIGENKHRPPPVDAGAVPWRLRDVLEKADTFVRAMPAGREGLLFLKDGATVQPDADNLAAYTAHGGSRRGFWPSSSEIGSAMVRDGPQKPC